MSARKEIESGTNLLCPKCRCEFATEAINIQTDVAYCEPCKKVFSVSTLAVETEVLNLDMTRPPPGVRFSRTSDGFTLSSTTRSAIAFFLVPFMCVWSGGSIGGIYGSQILSGHFSLVQSLFGIPFLLGSVFFWSVTLMAIAGKISLRVAGEEGRVFTGVGPIGWSRKFQWSKIKRVSDEPSKVSYPGGKAQSLALVGEDTINFGSGLSERRSTFVRQVLIRMIAEARRPDLEPGNLSMVADGNVRGELSVTHSKRGALSASADEPLGRRR